MDRNWFISKKKQCGPIPDTVKAELIYINWNIDFIIQVLMYMYTYLVPPFQDNLLYIQIQIYLQTKITDKICREIHWTDKIHKTFL